jgi:hypothetical protein
MNWPKPVDLRGKIELRPNNTIANISRLEYEKYLIRVVLAEGDTQFSAKSDVGELFTLNFERLDMN